MRSFFLSIAIVGACSLVARAYAQETTGNGGIPHFQGEMRNVPISFVVGDIRVEGLQRIAEGTVYNYLPVNIGDTLDSRRIAEAVRSLYQTKFFRDVELRRDGNVLVVVVLERPTIESFEVKGNKDIKTEDLEKSLRNVGLASGKTFDQSVLDEVRQYLVGQYYSRGKYSVRVDARAEEVPDNRVKVSIDIHEGARARIAQINIVGNSSFADDQLLGQLQLRKPNWLSWYRQDDRYAKEALAADLEALRSYYMDRGYADFAITSSQVAIGPEQKDIFITINVKEGEVYRVTDVKLAGDLRVPESELRRLIFLQPGEKYSQRLITQSTQAIRGRLGLDGYAFARIDAVPKLDAAGGQVAISLVIDPGNRVYVRRVNFLGTSSVNDEVFRRELRQLEGSYLSNAAVERSKIRLQRLPFVQDVEVETRPVPGTPDLVDVDYTLKEGLPGQFGGGIGYSQSQGVTLTGNIVHTNLLGTGQRLALEVSGGAYSKVYDVSYTDPYFTIDGISRTVNFSYRNVDRLTSSYSQFSTKVFSAGTELAYEITELQSIRFGASLEHAELATPLSSSLQLQDWVRHNGDPFFRLLSGGDFLLGSEYDAFELSAGWGRDSRNRVLFPTSGSLARLQLSATVPGTGEVEYLRSTLQLQKFFRLPLVPLTFTFNTNLSYSSSFGATSALPPNKHFFLGGPDSVRGFGDLTLGPRDSLGNPFGGDAALSGQLEAILPLPEKFKNSARLTAFVDFGQAYFLGDTEFTDKAGFPIDYDFDLGQLRVSAGVGVQWLAPLGLFRFSYAFPLRYQRETWRLHGDDIERFQFSVGRAF
jgi:outer membrane protein insertion porin family